MAVNVGLQRRSLNLSHRSRISVQKLATFHNLVHTRPNHRPQSSRLHSAQCFYAMADTLPVVPKKALPDTKVLQEASVVVVTIPACPYCKRAKAALTAAGIPYQELDASVDTTLRALVREVSGRSTVPQVFVGGKSFGGSDDLAAGLESGSFRSTLTAATADHVPALPPGIVQAVSKVAASLNQSSTLEDESTSVASAIRQRLAEVAALAADPEQGVRQQAQAIWSRTQKCFSGQDLLNWLTKAATTFPTSSNSSASAWLSQVATTPAGVADVANQFLAANLISLATDAIPPATTGGQGPQVQPLSKYFLSGGAAAPARGQPLNTSIWWNGQARPAGQVAEGLRDLILRLYERHLSADGRSVSYSGIKSDPLFQQFVAATAELQRVDLSPLSREELCALFINLYNANIIHALVVHGPPTNAAQRVTFFTRDAAYCIAGQTYTADDMENGVLRGNRAAASNLWVLIGLPKLAGGQFKPFDPRAQMVVRPMDPRIHFALVCGAKSCPPISVYTPDNLEEGLNAAGEAFCAGEVEVNVDKGVVKLSKILQWYSVDFGENDTEKLKFVLQFLKGKPRTDLESLLGSNRRIKVEYKPYDWALNS